jgi:amino acid adenylation domain-containing protein
VAGRPGDLPGVEAMVGLFINTLPVRVTVPGAEHVRPWLKRLQDRLVELRQYEQTSLVDIQGWTDVPRNQSLFDCLVVFENYPSDTESWQRAEGLEWRDLHTVERTNLPLNFIWMPEERLRLRILYNGARFDREAIERMGRHLHVLLNAIVANADAPLGSLSLLPEEERRRVTVEWNRTRTDYPRDACIHELFAEQARAHPDATALLLASTDGPSERDVRLTYADLDQRSDRLAARLRALGVRPDERVGLCGERSPDLVVVVLGILKAGGAYLPLDPAYPAERLGHMLRDSGARVVWTQRKFAGVLPALDGLTLVLDDEPAPPAALPPGRPTELNPDCLSYVMYTSGSTGTPKGVAVSHRNVVRLVRNTNYARLGPETVTLHFAPISFDASTYELWAALLNGGKVVLVPALTPSAADLGAVIRTYGINSLFMTSELFRVMVDDRVADLANVAQLFTGGDVLPVPQVKRALEKLPRCELYNVYGPTENTTFTTFYPIFGGGRVEPNVPIGRPISNSTVYILDPRLQPMPIGVPGELYTGGEGVAREYLNDAERTARCFVPDPFAGPPARMYRTGDLARWLPDGSVEFLGRVDNQVKIRGFRVETGEIETAMQNCPGVGQVAVVAVPTPGSGRRLVAYVVRAKDPTGAPADPRTALRQRLPEYMIPSQVIEVATLPMTPAGKVDRRKLASQPVPTAANRTATREPQTPEEQRLAAIWMDLLKTKAVGVDDNFFDLGGHSLLAMQFIARVQEQTGVRLTPNVLMYSTLAQLAKTLSDQAAGQKPGARADGSLLKRLAGRLRGKSAEAGQKPAETGS